MFTMNSSDTTSMPPPRKILRRGTPELDAAVEKGEIQLSLPTPPRNTHGSWIVNNDDSSQPSSHGNNEWSVSKSCLIQSHGYIDHTEQILKRDYGNNNDDSATPPDIEEEDYCSTASNTSTESIQLERDDLDRFPKSNLETKTEKDAESTVTSKTRTTNAEVSTRFRDIIGHGVVKLRLDEVLLPLALPPALADSILTGEQTSLPTRS